ncbi:MAG: DUF3344 domain-containing protein [Myxococcales bacterium]|nr:DUF3344 domain-containing protein [Myxococcales bacterium]
MSTTKKRIVLAGAGLLAVLLCTSSAAADPALRVQMDLNGDFVLFGNTLVHECGGGVAGIPAGPAPDPVVGTIGDCPQDNLLAPDVYWRSDSPADGEAWADSSLGPDDARSTAVLDLPAGAVVQYARMYWGALSTNKTPDPTVRVQRTDTGLDTEITADAGNSVVVPADQGTGIWYQSTADVTALISAQGPGAFRVTDVQSVDIVGLGEFAPTVAWYMVVLYEAPGEPSRNLAVFDGLDLVTSAIGSAAAALDGFVVPASGFDAKLGVVAYEGEAAIGGDALLFNDTTLSNAENPADNFFNASRTLLGAPLSVVGDLPQTTGEAGSLSNVDFDVVDVTSLVAADDTAATIEATSQSDTFLLSAFITSISTLKPEFVTSNKQVTDINGEGIRPGDVLEYTIEAINSGSDVAVNALITDPLPAGVTFVPDSISIDSGENTGDKTDEAGDDQAEYDDASRTVTVRIGTGADASVGGSLAIGESSTVSFQVTVDADAMGVISNQAVITAEGSQGSPEEDTVTDGNGEMPGQPPTDVEIDECGNDDDCEDPTPFCDVAGTPQRCVECTTSAQCTDPDAPDCDFDANVCTCVEGTDCDDSDGDGLSNGAEEALGTDPDDADTDDDGVPDGAEVAPNEDRDGDGLIGALDADSDNDGLFDGTELGLGCDDAGTDLSAGNCRPDGDMGATTTNPIDPDTDNGGLRDGSEDSNLNGVVDDGETDPTAGNGDDDSDPSDRDGDRLSDELEEFIGSDPDDADTDDDGVPDGDEPNPSADGDGDGLNTVRDVDSDNDGLFDGTELGFACDDPATDESAGHCRADNDGGATTTSPLDPDTDDGGATDGSEDANLNGVIDDGETDPTGGNEQEEANVA